MIPEQFAKTPADDDPRSLTPLICEGLLPLELPATQRNDLRQRLLRRVGDSVRRHAGLRTVRAGDGDWRAFKAGIRTKNLWEGAQGASVLIELAPGTSLPAHRHHYLEEGIVLRGGLQLGELALGPGDYQASPAGSRHARISSRTGALAYLRGTSLENTRKVLGERLGGLIPGNGAAKHTVFAGQGDWQRVASGVEQKILWRDGDVISCFFRLAAGAHLPAHTHNGDEECIMLSGDAFFGDVLLQAGDFHLAPAGSEHGEAYSEHGALAFIRSRAIPLLSPGR